MNKGIPIGIGIGIIALAVAFLIPGDDTSAQNKPPMGVELSDEIAIVADENKSYDVDITEGLKVGDGSP